LVTPRIVPLAEAARTAAGAPSRIVGSAANQVVRAWPKEAGTPALIDQRGAPDIAWIAHLGAATAKTEGPPQPLYLRAPDAKPQDAARLPRR
jgi:tRNA threonylcarbamoyladenosine biosynthesis protein TsaB